MCTIVCLNLLRRDKLENSIYKRLVARNELLKQDYQFVFSGGGGYDNVLHDVGMGNIKSILTIILCIFSMLIKARVACTLSDQLYVSFDARLTLPSYC